ncbi:MAG: hypothetical protein ABR541_02900 [Candidatus Dormibacteria bacterium]
MTDSRQADLSASRRGIVGSAMWVAAGALLLGTAVAVLGPPDLAAAHDLLTGSGATRPGALAVVGVVVWCGFGMILLAAVVGAVRAVRMQQRNRRGPWLRTCLIAGFGAAILAGGVARHATASPSLCCGSVPEARELAR